MVADMTYNDPVFEQALDKLATRFPNRPWDFRPDPATHDLISKWLGQEDEELMVCVFRGKYINEPFHRQDFFFFNYAWENEYHAYSSNSGNYITLHQDDCYVGQPFNGYALQADAEEELTIIGVLFRTDVFIREFLPTISSDSTILQFLLMPSSDQYSNQNIRLSFPDPLFIRTLLRLMVLVYASTDENRGAILKPLALSLIMMIAEEDQKQRSQASSEGTLPQRLLQYIRAHTASVSLTELARVFSYHPSYLSTLLKQTTGKTFSRHLLDCRMENALILLKNTDLSIEEIASVLGYSNKSNFHKVFLDYYHCTPRQYISGK